MSRTISILLGMGLAGLALVGCSKNNIAGPKLSLDSQDQATADRPASKNDYLVVDRPAVNDESFGGRGGGVAAAAMQIQGRPAALPADSKVVLEGRPAVLSTDDKMVLENRPMPVPTNGGWLYIEGRPAAAPTGDKAVLEGRPAAVPSGDKVVLEGRAMAVPQWIVQDDPSR